MRSLNHFKKSVWFFPVLLLTPLILLTAFKISGSSIGVYNLLLYGPSSSDHNLVAGEPRSIRSDEWLVGSQQIAAQAKSGYPRINPDLGNGQDMTTLDVPYKEWSILFKPHNLVFFVLPFDFAFAFRWWIFAYLLIVSAYFFIVTLLPSRRLFATIASSAFFFSPFVQWWYAYGTFASLYFSLFLATAGILLLRAKTFKRRLIYGLSIAYLLGCLSLVLYPPFQIACGLIVFMLFLGFLLEHRPDWKKPRFQKNLVTLVLASMVGVAVAGAFIFTRLDTINTINSTAYPGQRVQQSGGYDGRHLFSGHLAAQHQSDDRSQKYDLKDQGITNQSEAAGFIMLSALLIVPSSVVLYKSKKLKQKRDWPLLIVCLTTLILLAQLFIGWFNPIGKLLLLEKIPHNRILIGIGLLGMVHLVLFIRHLDKHKTVKLGSYFVATYVLLVLILQLYLSLYARTKFPGFIGLPKAALLSLAVPVIMYFLLTKRYVIAAVILLVFSVFSSARVNPLYRGVDPLVNNPLSSNIRQLSSEQPGKWAAESMVLENLPMANGASSLSGVYAFPQKELWASLDNAREEPESFNRYAHANFDFDRNSNEVVPTNIKLISPDNFTIMSEPCSDFVKSSNVRFIIAVSPLADSSGCLLLASKIEYPAMPLYIYQLQY